MPGGLSPVLTPEWREGGRVPDLRHSASLYGFRFIPAQSGKRRLCIHIAESVFFPTRIRSD
ncbi:hypothetical protein DVJ83_11305 [Deinococcus wulumuqiensis]|uniref:Uncharacterized protein n=1 Tax=Deinococcus wulumuqiensis TaxID=980427 RepID=A0A345IIU4_9DEIO|nr:hypothetical protein DVJ83_11305 [Deinococcus wulumuqiensis]